MDLILPILAAALYAAATVLALVGVWRPQNLKQKLIRGLFICGFAVHTLVLILHAVQYGGIPIGKLSETVLLFLWCIALVGLFVACFYKLTALSAYILPVLVVFSAGAAALAHRGGEVPEGLNAFWTALHTIPIFLGFAFFALGFAASLLYLTQERRLKSKLLEPLIARLPSLETLDRTAKMSTLIGFPLYTLGLILGIVWARSGSAVALGWPPDAIIVVGIVAWVVYCALVHVRLAEITHGRKVAYLTIAGFILVIAAFLGSLVFGQFHTLKGTAAAAREVRIADSHSVSCGRIKAK
ncbi:MAG: cytochrome c biogenesis protein CcsA [Planctomycetes bacterium]|nr:cytochrome c biogenesis protein CcsA [Planctomycetota bacterium]